MGNMAHAHLPHFALVHGGCTPHLNALGIHRGAQQRHHVFPAHRAADTPHRGVDHRQGRAVALAPDQPLGAGRHQLAVLGHQAARGFEIQHRAVQRAATAFDHAQHQAGTGTRRHPGQRLGFWPRHVNGIGKIPCKGFPALGQAIAQLRAKAFALGIAAQQRLGHDHQVRATALDLILIGQDLRQGFSLAARQGADLQGCDSRYGHQAHSDR